MAEVSVTKERLDPRRLTVAIQLPSGAYSRWGPDEANPQNVPSGIQFGTKSTGGFTSFSCKLARKPNTDYPDLSRFAPMTCYGPGASLTAFDGYLSSAPFTRTNEYAYHPEFVGWSGALAKDDPSFKEIYVDADLTHWQEPSLTRKIGLLNGGYSVQSPPSVIPDASTGAPSLECSFPGSWAAGSLPLCEGLYDAQAITIASVYYAWKKGPKVILPDGNHVWSVYTMTDDVATVSENTGNLNSAGPGSGTLTAGAGTPRKFATVQFYYGAGPAGNNGDTYTIDWTALSVFGNHGLPKVNTSNTGASGGPELYAKDIIADIIKRNAPMLNYTTGAGGSIYPHTFTFPHMVFLDPVDGETALNKVNEPFLYDWGVYENKTFFWQSPGSGRNWRLRVSDAVQPDESGPTIEQSYNGVVVQFTDVTGKTRTVGPPGSTTNTTNALLQDLSSTNPVNVYNRKRWALLTMGTTTSAVALAVGQIFLTTINQRQTHGQARVVGSATDSNGREWPAWMIRGGDTVTYEDSVDKTTRYIIDTSYDHDSLTNSLTLDAPPNKVDWLIARLGVVIQPLGFS